MLEDKSPLTGIFNVYHPLIITVTPLIAYNIIAFIKKHKYFSLIKNLLPIAECQLQIFSEKLDMVSRRSHGFHFGPFNPTFIQYDSWPTVSKMGRLVWNPTVGPLKY